ncbi:MAG: ornithine cyclodeaminase family protein, partial [Gammaproteobacteria bacterium]
MNTISFADARTIEETLSFHKLIIELKQAFADASITTPARHHHDYLNPVEEIDSSLLLMPSWKSGSHLGVKLVTVSPNNYKYNLPSIQGLYILFDAAKGTPLMLLDAQELTARRTASSSALASTFLSRRDSETLLMVGTGTLAPYLIEAHVTVRRYKKILIWGRNRD